MPKMGKSTTAYLGTLLTLLTLAVLTISVFTLVRVFSTTSNSPAAANDDTTNRPVISTSPSNTVDSSVQYQAYSSYAKVLKESLVVKADPCDDFYKFSCGSFSKSTNFADMQTKNFDVLARQLSNRAYIDGYQKPKVLKQVSTFYSQCVRAKTDWPSYIGNGQIIKRKLANLKDILGVPFPFSAEYVDTFFVADVWPNIRNHDSKQSYEFHIYQPQLALEDNYYIKYWDTFQASYINDSINYIQNLGESYELNILNASRIAEAVKKMAEMEYKVATSVNTPAKHRVNYTSIKVPMTIAQASVAYPFIDWLTYFTSFSSKPFQLASDYQFVLNEPAVFTRLFQLLNSSSIEPQTIYNYFYFRLLWQYSDYIPFNKQTVISTVVEKNSFKSPSTRPRRSNLLGRSKISGGVIFPFIENGIAKSSNQPRNDFPTIVMRSCARDAMYMMPSASGRVFLDAVLPDVKQRAVFISNVGQIVADLLSSFEGMVMKLDWMSSGTKYKIAMKAKNLVRNIAYPDFITDNGMLNQVYNALDIDPDNKTNNYDTLKEKIRQFDNGWLVKAVFNKGEIKVDRAEFVLPTSMVNAMFMYNLNSITVPLGLLQEPFYNPNYPAAVNYGALGSLLGHELAHSLDIYGIQFDGVGILSPILDDESRTGYDGMQQCLVDEYNTFKPVNQLWSVDAAQTLPDNFADNAGIRAAYSAFTAYRAYYGQEPLLPDQVAGVFNPDQLFFLSFAQLWCQNVPDYYIRDQLLTGVHSPGKYRIIGSIRNFPAFRSAFNCPVGSNHAPTQHCNVLASESKQYVGVPPMTATLPSTNIQLKSQSQSVKFSQAASNFEKSIDLSYDPCTNFYDYSCAKFEGSMSFDRADDLLFGKTIDGLNKPIKSKQDSLPVQQVKKLYNQCLYVNSNWTRYTEHGTLVKAAISQFEDQVGWDFPTFSPSTSFSDWPHTFDIGWATGYLAGVEGISTLVSSFVATDWGNSQLSRAPYKLFFDQSRLAMPRNFYVGKVWDMFSAGYRASILQLFTRYGQLVNVTVDANVMAKDIDDIVTLEWILANNFTTDVVTRRDFNRSYNLMDVGQAYKTTKFLDLRAFTASLLNYADDQTWFGMVEKDSWYKVIVMEPGQIAKLNTYFKPGNSFGFTGRQLINYFFYRLLRSKRVFLPPVQMTKYNEHTLKLYSKHWPEANTPKARDIELVNRVGAEQEHKDLKKQHGKSAQDSIKKDQFRTEEDFVEISESLNRIRIENGEATSKKKYTESEVECMLTGVAYMPYASARVLIDEMLPKEEDRSLLKAKAQEVIENVIVGFRSMIDQLSWMNYHSKLGAYSKIDELVRNVAYPDYVTNNTGLTAYYKDLKFTNDHFFFSILKDLNIYYYQQEWALLHYDEPNADRTRFGIPGITNAWYNPSLNSITFPLGILQQPFFDPEWPASVNYGALGLIAGHELTHGFDDHGIQWNGIGVLQQWIDDDSKAAFRRMADCIVDEYSSFCPLDADNYQPNCIDGHHTQGENIADNGGMIAAFRAYRNVIGYGGEEQLLPGSLTGQYTHDQLFFLSFAQVWCQKQPSVERLQDQLLYDPHSPSRYRVLGTVQNFPAFRNAFNCPQRSANALPATCDVYVTPPKQITGGPPPTTTTLPMLNILQPIASANLVSRAMGKFFEAHMDTTQDPCDNFYEYTCKNYKFLPSFYLADLECVYQTEIGLLSITSDDPRSLRQARLFYDRCIYDYEHPEVEYNITQGNQQFKNLYNKFRFETELDFPLLKTATKTNQPNDDDDDDASNEDLDWPDMSQLGYSLGLMSTEFDVDTLVSSFVDTNWADPQGKQPYALYIDQPSLFEDAVVYTTPMIWQSFKPRYKNYIMALFRQFSRVMHVYLEKADIEEAAEQILYFEHTLAINFSTPENQRRNFSRSYNPFDLDGLFSWDKDKLFSISMSEYAYSLLQMAPKEVVQRYLFEKSKFVVVEPEQLFKLDKALNDQNAFGFKPEHLLNYLYFRVLDRIARYFSPLETLRSPDLFNALDQLHEISPLKSRFKPLLGKASMQEDFVFKYFPLHTQIQRDQNGLATSITFDNYFFCAHNTRIMVPFAAGRAFVDQIYPTKKHKKAIKQAVGKMIDQVISAFQGMLGQLDWMTESTRVGAYNKLNNMVRNIAYPDFIVDDDKLDAYYAGLNLSSSQNSDEMFHELMRFYTMKSLTKLGERKGTDRTDWGMGPAVVNAWFQPQLGSITFPAAILTPPFFSIDLPSAANYAFGAIVGHELTHGFDDQGVQFDGVGKMHNWMDSPSTSAFNNMAQCVVDQYTGFCPNGGPFCLDGVNTQGENIADNGGIRAAFRAYQNSLGLNGQDKALPGQLMSQFSGNQLFFLSFAQTWCSASGGEGNLMSILLDPHSPSKYRVLGTLQNYPAFKNAFNCPAKSLYSQKKCDVWITDVKTVTGIPPTTTTIPPLNIPIREKSNSAKYMNASNLIEQSVDNTQDPCNNFYGYTCNKDLSSEFGQVDIDALVALARDEIKDDNEAIYPLEQAKAFFRQCVDYSKSRLQIDQSEHLISKLLQQLSDEFGFFFPVYNQTYQPTWPNASELSRAIGYISGRLFANSLLSDYVDTHWKEPDSTEQPYIMFIDQATTLMDPLVYHPRLWNSFQDDILEYIHNLLEWTAEILGHETTWEQLHNASRQILDMDYIIATQLNTNESIRRGDFDRNYNFFSIEEAQQDFSVVDWKKYFAELVYYAPVQVQNIVNKMDGTGFGFSLMEPDALLRLQKVLKQDNDYGFTPKQLVNYLYFVVIWKYGDIIVPPSKKEEVMQRKVMSYVRQTHTSKQSPRTQTPSSPIHSFNNKRLNSNHYDDKVSPKSKVNVGWTEVDCAYSTLDNMDVASGRLYIDHILPDVNDDRQRLRESAKKMLNGVLLGFRSMIDQLPWMSVETKHHAYSKMDGMVVNIGYPDMLTDNQKIIDHYSVLNFSLTDSYHKMLHELNKFSHYQSYAVLGRKDGIKRDDFNGVVTFANAWYQPQLNSITLPLAILQQPFFDPEWPAAVNIGGLGTILGHELTHGFDDMGIQWDANGTLNHWMDETSTRSFNQMAQCVVDEYNGFCPLDAEEFQPNCLDGANTLGENIADNGGIHAAYRAYRHFLDVNGPDKALPGDLVGQYTHDQLFFLSFAKLMCSYTNNMDEWVSILVDVHSPPYYRTLGTLRNFPAFQDAFNCPNGSLYSPGQHCKVWVS
uniref:Uncharacterized protein n=1 Tax=Ditylenchus dipsaci TaxID=166011 RepID=A0A915EDN2_9BILA